MPKVIGITVGLLILKTGEIILIYQAMPLIRRLWKRVLATDSYRYAPRLPLVICSFKRALFRRKNEGKAA